MIRADLALCWKCKFSERRIYFNICGTRALRRLRFTGHLIFSTAYGGQNPGRFQYHPEDRFHEGCIEYEARRICTERRHVTPELTPMLFATQRLHASRVALQQQIQKSRYNHGFEPVTETRASNVFRSRSLKSRNSVLDDRSIQEASCDPSGAYANIESVPPTYTAPALPPLCHLIVVLP
jgi:hypothetical protein